MNALSWRWLKHKCKKSRFAKTPWFWPIVTFWKLCCFFGVRCGGLIGRASKRFSYVQCFIIGDPAHLYRLFSPRVDDSWEHIALHLAKHWRVASFKLSEINADSGGRRVEIAYPSQPSPKPCFLKLIISYATFTGRNENNFFLRGSTYLDLAPLYWDLK